MLSLAPRAIADLPPRQQRAAYLVAEDKQSDRLIAAEVGVTPMTLARWKRRPDFQAAVQQAAADLLAAVKREGLANKQNRMDALNADFARLEQVIAERATDPLMQGIAGGTTGLLVAEPMLVKVWDVGNDESDGDESGSLGAKPVESRIVYAYKVDDAVIRRRQELAKQMAIEVGEWSEKRDVTTRGATDINVTHEHRINLDEFATAFAEVAGLDSDRLRLAPIDGVGQRVDSPEADTTAGGVPGDTSS